MSQAPTHVTNHLDIALGNLLQQYSDRPKIRGLLTALIGPLQTFEDSMIALPALTSVNGALGVQLDRLGVIVGQPRGGLTDEPYRIRIKIRIIQNISQGEPDTLIAVYQALTGSNSVQIQENYPAGVRLNSDGNIPNGQETVTWQNIQEVAAAGVRVDCISTSNSPKAFKFAGGLTVGGGFGDEADPSVGGPMAFQRVATGLRFAFAGGSSNNLGFGDKRDPVMGGHLIGA